MVKKIKGQEERDPFEILMYSYTEDEYDELCGGKDWKNLIDPALECFLDGMPGFVEDMWRSEEDYCGVAGCFDSLLEAVYILGYRAGRKDQAHPANKLIRKLAKKE